MGVGMRRGLYKVEMQTVHGSRRGVLYVYDGKVMGGNAAFAFIGTYREAAGEILLDFSTIRHNDDPEFQPLLKTNEVDLVLRGRGRGEQYHFEGGTTALPGAAAAALPSSASAAGYCFSSINTTPRCICGPAAASS